MRIFKRSRVRATLPLMIGGWLTLSAAIAQTADPMQPPPDRRPVITPGENSLAAAILESLTGDARAAERLNVLKRLGSDRVTALIEAGDTREAQTVKATQSAAYDGETLVIRSESGERTFSPHPLVKKTPRPVGSTSASGASQPTSRSP